MRSLATPSWLAPSFAQLHGSLINRAPELAELVASGVPVRTIAQLYPVEPLAYLPAMRATVVNRERLLALLHANFGAKEQFWSEFITDDTSAEFQAFIRHADAQAMYDLAQRTLSTRDIAGLPDNIDGQPFRVNDHLYWAMSGLVLAVGALLDFEQGLRQVEAASPLEPGEASPLAAAALRAYVEHCLRHWF